MIIKTDKLKELVAQALEDDKRQWEQEELDFDARKAKHLQDWLDNVGPKWLETADLIRAKINRGEPITEEDMPRDKDRYGYGRPAYFSRLSPSSRHEKDYVAGKAVYKQPRDLVQFQQFLELVEGDTISTSALKDHGLVNIQNRILQYVHSAAER